MSRWRVAVVLLLIGGPFLFLAGLGSLYLWEKQLSFAVWWPMAACFVLGYVLAWYWQHRRKLLRPVDFTAPPHWTERDRQAWQLVEERAMAAVKLPPARFTEIAFYTATAQEMGLELARFYHPGARDPVASLTIPEILAVIELASHDVADLVDRYLPAGHLLTIKNWRQAKQATDWYQRLNQVYWLVSAVFSPAETGLRYATSRLGMSRPWQMLQENLLLWFYTVVIHRLGTYLIDLNSGRLRVGARRYRELMEENRPPDPMGPPADLSPPVPVVRDASDQVRRVTLAVVGQVKAGKSSFINALLGEQLALADVLPTTGAVTRYELQPPGIPTRLVLLDTPGYGHRGPDEDQVKATEEAARHADIVLLIAHARNPARQADLDMLKHLRQWFAAQPDLRMPPVLGILTHIDLLSPALEWQPPYHWQEPRRPKEQNIHEAWAVLRQQLGDALVGIVPACTAAGKVYGIEEWFLPTLAELLDEARTVALLRCLRAEADTGRMHKVFQQLLLAGKQMAQVAWDSLPEDGKSVPPGPKGPPQGGP